jgi:DMSO/TMAO reductase YedYZ molybdopterin-dependent catalytic subunit
MNTPRWPVVVLLLCLLTGCAIAGAGCGGKTQTSRFLKSEERLEGMYEACRTVEISDPAATHSPILADELPGYPRVDVQTELVRSNGMRLPGTWSGASLSEILARHGVEGPFSELRIVAWDEYVAKVPYDVAMRPDTILAYEQDGEPLPQEDGPMRLVVGSEDGFYWIRMIVRLEIVR